MKDGLDGKILRRSRSTRELIGLNVSAKGRKRQKGPRREDFTNTFESKTSGSKRLRQKAKEKSVREGKEEENRNYLKGYVVFR